METNWSEIKFFNKKEFDCSFSGFNKMQREFMDALIDVRAHFGKPMIVTSGYRDASHPIESSKPRSGGEHTLGLCCDILCNNSYDRFQIINISLSLGKIHRIGVGANFLHLGIGANHLPKNVIWIYK